MTQYNAFEISNRLALDSSVVKSNVKRVILVVIMIVALVIAVGMVDVVVWFMD